MASRHTKRAHRAPSARCPLLRGSLALWAARWAAPAAANEGAGDPPDRFVIASFTEPPQLAYLRVSDPAWRPLVAEGLLVPGAVCVDPANMRLFVSDTEAMKVYWYQLSVKSGSHLVAIDPPRVAVEKIVAKGLGVDGIGSLYIAGAHWEVFDSDNPEMGIWKQDAVKLATASSVEAPGEPARVWSQANTDLTGDQQSPQLFEASSVAVDNLLMFWGNYLRGPESGAIVKASVTVPTINPLAQVVPLANNVLPDQLVTSIALTTANLFYTVEGEGGGAIYGISRSKTTMSCGIGNAVCPLIATVEQGPTGMTWDGDSTVYVAAGGVDDGAIYSFASGALSPHVLERLCDAEAVWDLAILDVPPSSSAAARVVQAVGALAAAVAAALAPLLTT